MSRSRCARIGIHAGVHTFTHNVIKVELTVFTLGIGVVPQTSYVNGGSCASTATSLLDVMGSSPTWSTCCVILGVGTAVPLSWHGFHDVALSFVLLGTPKKS